MDARWTVFDQTRLEDCSRSNPMRAASTVLNWIDGSLRSAITAVRNRSNVQYITEPDESGWNSIARGGNRFAESLAANRMGFATSPSAIRVPSTNRVTSGSNNTRVPAKIVRVTPGSTVTSAVRTYVSSSGGEPSIPQTVFDAIDPLTKVTAAAVGATTSRVMKDERTTARARARLRQGREERWACMCDCGSEGGVRQNRVAGPVESMDILSAWLRYRPR